MALARRGDCAGGEAPLQNCRPLPPPTQWRTGGVVAANASSSELATPSSELRIAESAHAPPAPAWVSKLLTGGAGRLGGGRLNSENLGDAIAARMVSSVKPGGMQSPISEKSEHAGGCGGGRCVGGAAVGRFFRETSDQGATPLLPTVFAATPQRRAEGPWL